MAAERDKIFISYSHRDIEAAKELHALLEALGFEVWRDEARLQLGDNYVMQIHHGIAHAARVIVLWSPAAVASEYVTAEAEFARNAKKLVPLEAEACSPQVPFNIFHRLPLAIVRERPHILARALGAKEEKGGTWRVFSLDPEDVRTSGKAGMPRTYTDELFGRDQELALLYDAWDGGLTHVVAFDAIGGQGKTALIKKFFELLETGSWRGAQKVFVWSFYSQGTDENRQGDADPFFIEALTFFGYEREAAEAEAAKEAGRKPTEKEVRDQQLAFIRRELPSPADKGKALAKLVRRQRTLLFLDGVEPVQYPTGKRGGGAKSEDGEQQRSGIGGAFKDKGLFTLLRELATDQPGLTLITTRVPLTDLKDYAAPQVEKHPLDRLDDEAAVALMKVRGVDGPDKDFKLLIDRLRGHALALNTAASYLVTHHKGDVRHARELPALVPVGGDQERDAFRVFSAYEIEYKKEIDRQLGKTKAGRRRLDLFRWLKRGKDKQLAKLDMTTLSAKALETAAGKQLALLYIMGLFDQPIERRVFDALIAPPAIPGLTDGIEAAHVRQTQWNEAIRVLRDHQLLAPADEHAGDKLDCHPLVREYFGQRLQQIDETAFRAAHSRLYDFYRYDGLPEAFREPVAYGVLALRAAFERDHYPMLRKGLLDGSLSDNLRSQCPPSIAELQPDALQQAFSLVDGPQWPRAKAALLPANETAMQPLFSAIEHGCRAWREEEAFNEVYWPRVTRGNAYFAVRQLGLYGPELSAIAAFFARPFEAPSPRLAARIQAVLFNLTGAWLRALGRLEDSVAPMRGGSTLQTEMGDMHNASSGLSNLAELLLTLGRVDEAAVAATAAVTYADLSKNQFQRQSVRTNRAEALLASSELGQAQKLLAAAETIQKGWQPDLPRLYSLSGFRINDLLLARGRSAEAAARARYALEAHALTHSGAKLDIALDRLTLARAALAVVQEKLRPLEIERATNLDPRLHPGSISPDAEAPAETPVYMDPGFRRDDNREGGDRSVAAEALGLAVAARDALRVANSEDDMPRGLLVHAEAAWWAGDLDAASDSLLEALDSTARGPMPLFAAEAHLLAARIHLDLDDMEKAREERQLAANLIDKHKYGRGAVALAVLDAELAYSVGEDFSAKFEMAIKAVSGTPWHDEESGETIDGGWFGHLPRLAAIAPADHPGLADIAARAQRYNEAEDERWQAQEQEWQEIRAREAHERGEDIPDAEVDAALADAGHRQTLDQYFERKGMPPLADLPLAEQRRYARKLLAEIRAQKEKPTPSAAGFDPSAIPDELVDHALVDPAMRSAMEGALQQMGMPMKLDDMPKDMVKALIAAIMAAKRKS